MSRYTSLPRILKKPVKLVFLGLDYAGKTAMVLRMKTGKFEEDLLPTAFSEQTLIKISSTLQLLTIDLGGHKDLRNHWDEAIIEATGIIFVLDANNNDRFHEAKVEFHNRVKPYLADKPCAVAANKFDLIWEKQPDMNRERLMEELELFVQSKLNLPKISELAVFATSQKSGTGNSDVISFLRERLIQKQ